MTDPGDQNVHRPEAPPRCPETLDLFNTEAHARATDPSTSQEGAAAARMTNLQEEVYRAVRTLERPVTSADVADFLGKRRDVVSPRFKPLERAGRLRRVGKEGRRTLWVIA